MRGLLDYLRIGVWERDLRDAPWRTKLWLGALRAILTVIANFERHRVSTSAGSLTVTTLLAVVPLAALIFSVARGFGFGAELDKQLVDYAAELPENFRGVVYQVRDLVNAVDFGKLGAASTLLVGYTGLSLFVRVERAINHAWEAAATRSWLRRLTDFIALVVVVPLFAIAALSMSSFLASASAVVSLRESLPWIGWLYDSGLGFMPHVMLGIAFTALYKFLPNTTVEWRAALIGGFVGGFALVFMHSLYLKLQIGVARSNAIYATLAALPLLIVYLQFAWTIVLVGAEIGHAAQHASLLRGGMHLRKPTPAVRERVALALTERAVQCFVSGEGGMRLDRAAVELDVPRDVLEVVCEELRRGGVIARVGRDKIMPAKPGEQISLADVRVAIGGGVPAVVREHVTLSDPLESALRGVESADRASRASIKFSA